MEKIQKSNNITENKDTQNQLMNVTLLRMFETFLIFDSLIHIIDGKCLVLNIKEAHKKI